MPTLKSTMVCNATRASLCLLAAMHLAFTCSSGAQSCPKAGEKHGYWSKQAIVVCENLATSQMHLEMSSPDSKKLLFVTGKDLVGTFFLKSGDETNRESLFPAYVGAEALWSPDSKGVAVTTCYGGGGPCTVQTTLDDDRESPTAIVSDLFSEGHKNDMCYTNANVGVLTWEKSSESIVLIVEIPPSPQCDGHNGGYFEAFVVSFSERKVVSRFNMQETVRRWHSILGAGLLNDIELVREGAKNARK